MTQNSQPTSLRPTGPSIVPNASKKAITYAQSSIVQPKVEFKEQVKSKSPMITTSSTSKNFKSIQMVSKLPLAPLQNSFVDEVGIKGSAKVNLSSMAPQMKKEQTVGFVARQDEKPI